MSDDHTDDEISELDVGDLPREPVVITDSEIDPLPGGQVLDTAIAGVVTTPHDRRLFMQELVRAMLAFSFVLLLAGVIVLAYLHLGDKDWAHTKEYLDILVPALSALLGSATGFYFASRR